MLLVRRRKPAEAGHWSLVGGKIDFMEDAQSAVSRECREEVGVEPHGLRLLSVSEQRLAAEDQHWISLIYLAESFSGEPALLEPEKHAELGWFDPASAPAPLALGAAHGLDMLRAFPGA
ncbi:NUDIX domain-containing protein [Antarcticirhabdus aurantiaca]|uniref:NUDIX domain-containing protein n=1 Tax=Antarcticirhabdus aurantiaca TaxID=2606717 RepID=A0ACD4NW56_9HYPH|nr:NUDIX domain-containing protein [Jeongeuplla avenae]